MPEDLGPIEKTSHLLPLPLPPRFTVYKNNQLIAESANNGTAGLVRANRTRLREWLAVNLQVNWGMNWTRIEEKDDTVLLHFDDGTTRTGDILVGADGTKSKGDAKNATWSRLH